MCHCTSKILAATIIVDHFIQMLTGVYEFRQSLGGDHLKTERKLKDIINKYFNTYSILSSVRRPGNLTLNMDFDDSCTIPYCVDIFEYLVSIFLDCSFALFRVNMVLA